MTIREATLKVMNSSHRPMRQSDIYKEVSKITGYSIESCRCNSFRNPNAIPELHTNFRKIKMNNRIHYIKSKGSKYRQDYKKPKEYFKWLKYLNKVDGVIYTLAGTESHCLKVLDRKKTITVDMSPLCNPDLRKNIFTIKDGNAYNLDFEGLVTDKKVKFINSLNAEYILFTFRKTKTDKLLKKITSYKVIKKSEYKSGRDLMGIYLFSKCHNLIGDSSNR